LKNEWKDKKIFLLNPKILDTDFHKNAFVETKNIFSLPEFKEEQYTKMEDILLVVQNILS
jgi:hypothetical protein